MCGQNDIGVATDSARLPGDDRGVVDVAVGTGQPPRGDSVWRSGYPTPPVDEEDDLVGEPESGCGEGQEV